MKHSIPELVAEREDLRARLAEAEEVLHAIRNGEVDAVVVAGEHGEQVYTLSGANRTYRQLIETMSEGALTLSADGVILYCNVCLAKMLGRPLDQVLGSPLRDYLSDADREEIEAILTQTGTAPSHREINLKTSEGRLVPVYLSAFRLPGDGAGMVFCLVLTDLTEQKYHEQIAEDERLAREILEQALEAIIVCDEEGRVIRASQATQQLCDGSPLLQPFAEAFPLRTDASKPFQLAPVLQGETLRNVDMDLERRGQKFDLILNAGPLLSGQQILGCVVTLTDITEHKRTEAALRETNEYLGNFFSYANAPIMVWNPQFHITNVNHAFESLVGRKAREIVGSPLQALFPPDSVASSMELIKETLGGNRWEMIEIKIQRRDGSVRSVLWNSATVFDADGKTPIAAFAQGLDITERERAERELQNLRTAVEQSANSIVITNPKGDIEYVNPAFEKATGYTAAEALGSNPRILKSGEQDAAFYRDLWTTITSGQIWRGEFHNKRKDGSLYWESATLSPVRNAKGEIVRFIAIKEDITERKAMEVRLKKALLDAQAAAVTKSEFLAVMSHELRTPLNGVLGFAELLSDTPLDEEQKGYTQTITSSGNHLLAVVNDILDFSSIESGTLAIQVAPLAISELVESSDLVAREAAADKGLEFRCEVAAGVPEQITGDARRIRQILINLLGNAVKFTTRGSVVLRVTASSEGGLPALDFSVEDTGIGISLETLGRLFKPFVQANSTHSRQFGGTGLGLAISKRLAEAMGGSITVTSTPEKGSTFTFHLPLEVSPGGMASVPSHLFMGADGASPSSPSAESPMPPAGDLVLVVEDDPDNSRLAGKMLQSLGYRADFAAHGAEAVAAFAPGKYFAILMDVLMPVMDGLVATKQIRGLESKSRVPIIALTANVMPGDRERYLAAGMDDFLPKPFKRDELADKLARVAQPSR